MYKYRCTYRDSQNKECMSADTFKIEFEYSHGGGFTTTCREHAETVKLQYEAAGYVVYLGETKCPQCGGSGKISELET